MGRAQRAPPQEFARKMVGLADHAPHGARRPTLHSLNQAPRPKPEDPRPKTCLGISANFRLIVPLRAPIIHT